MIRDDLGAFVGHCDTVLAGAENGLLRNLTFAVKDIFDIAGCRTGCGNPDWLRSHEAAQRSAPVVDKLVAAGATMIGKTVTEEMAYSLIGENAHYGAPVNVNAPGRVAGGSSSGSAAAVAAGDAHFALGSDTGGSVRIPASFCGIYGLRPTHGRVPLEGIMPLAASFDTIGWFARDPAVLSGIAGVLFDEWQEPAILTGLYVPEDAWAQADPEVQAALAPALERVEALVGPRRSMLLGVDYSLQPFVDAYMVLQGREAWETHREWIGAVRPAFGPGIAERFETISQLTDSQVERWTSWRVDFTEQMTGLLDGGAIIALPTAPCIAPWRDLEPDKLADIRKRILMLTSAASLAGLPQVSLPVATADGCPVGLSLIGRPGGDEELLDLARRVGRGEKES
jgi:amidase